VDGLTEMGLTYGPIVLMGLLFYFLLYRPQKNAQAKRKAMLDQMSVGDKVMTIGGIYGEVVSIEEQAINIKVANDVVMKFNKAAINMNITRQGEAAN
jgi:preprotein translocase subunit YajC